METRLINYNIKQITMNKTELSQILANNLDYYVSNPSNRNVDSIGLCRYSSESLNKNGDGCFVGKLMDKQDRIKVDGFFSDKNDSSVIDLILNKEKIGIELPSIINDNSDIMIDFQNLHDQCQNWGEDGLSDSGKGELSRIIVRNSLDEEVFKKFLV